MAACCIGSPDADCRGNAWAVRREIARRNAAEDPTLRRITRRASVLLQMIDSLDSLPEERFYCRGREPTPVSKLCLSWS